MLKMVSFGEFLKIISNTIFWMILKQYAPHQFSVNIHSFALSCNQFYKGVKNQPDGSGTTVVPI